MPQPNGNRPAARPPGDPETSAYQGAGTHDYTALTSTRTVDWWGVHQYVNPTLQRVGSWPTVGTLEWQEADDAVKLASIFDAARRWALYVESNQQVMVEASHAISAAADWSAESLAQRRHADAVESGAYIPRVAA